MLQQDLLAFTQEVWVFLLLATFLALVIMLIGKKFSRIQALLLLCIYLIFLVFVVTQVEKDLSGLGEQLGGFLRKVAFWIGVYLH